MKILIHKILHWSNFVIIALILISVISLLTLYFASTYIGKHHNEIEQLASKAIRQPVKIGSVTIGNHGLEPVVKLRNVVIFNDAKTKKILQARELQIGIDLIGSLIQWKIKPGLLLLRGSEATINQDKDGKIDIVGLSNSLPITTDTKPNIPNEISLWLLEQNKIYLEDITLKLNLVNGDMKLYDLSIKLDNDILQRNLRIDGKLKQKNSPATFKANLKLHGDFSKHPFSSIKGKLTIENWNHKLRFQKPSKDFSFVPRAGEINLSIKNSNLETRFLRQTMPIRNISGKIVWQQNNDDLKINISRLQFTDNWLILKGKSKLLFLNSSKMPIVDIQLGFDLKNLAKAKLYYPTTILPPDATAWLDKAFTNSKKISGNMILQGPLNKFPFDNNEGKFLVNTNLRSVDLKYDEEWPQVDNINGLMIFSGRSLTITANNALILGEPTKFIKAVIPDLEYPFLHIIGSINTRSDIGLKFINSCPLKNTIGHKMQDISLQGSMRLNLKLDMPLSDNIIDQTTHVKGDIKLHKNQIDSAWGFKIKNLNGNLSFDENDLTADNLQGRLFDNPINLSIKTIDSNNKNTITRVAISGSTNVKDFAKLFMVKLQPNAFGNFNYKATLDLPNSSKQNILKLTSNLKGVKVRLPKPFDKKLEDDYKFNLTCHFGGKKSTKVTINYNDQINAALKVKKTGDDQLAILAGEVKFGKSPAKIPTKPGLKITGSLAKLDWPTWRAFLLKTQNKTKIEDSIIKQINLKIAKLILFGEIFKNVLLKAEAKDVGWESVFSMPNIDGKIFIPNNPKKHIQGSFKKLYLSEGQKNIDELKPRKLPPLNFKIDDFRYNDRSFKKITLITEKHDDGLKISQLTINDQRFNIEANGNWLAGDKTQSSMFRGKIKSNDIGGLLKHWGLSNNVFGGKGEMNFSLKWPSPPYSLDLENVSGSCAINVTNGRIINLGKKAETKLGLGRLLSILSLQSLPRRLALDFRDLSTQGFEFNTLQSNIELSQKNVFIKSLILDGPVATIKAYGKIGLKDKACDIMLSTAPHITSSIPVAATIAGGPIAFIISLVAEKILSTAIVKTAAFNYHVTGPLDNLTINKK